MARMRLWLDTLRTSLWFGPSVIGIGAVVLAYGMLALDAMLPVIGGSMITVVGVVFFIIIAALTLASGQYTCMDWIPDHEPAREQAAAVPPIARRAGQADNTPVFRPMRTKASMA